MNNFKGLSVKFVYIPLSPSQAARAACHCQCGRSHGERERRMAVTAVRYTEVLVNRFLSPFFDGHVREWARRRTRTHWGRPMPSATRSIYRQDDYRRCMARRAISRPSCQTRHANRRLYPQRAISRRHFLRYRVAESWRIGIGAGIAWCRLSVRCLGERLVRRPVRGSAVGGCCWNAQSAAEIRALGAAEYGLDPMKELL
jgi:hypothetical protein